MKVINCKVTDNEMFIVPIGDIHCGDKGFTKESQRKLKETIDWVKETPNSRIFLNGDLLNCSTRISKTSPYDQNMDLGEQKDYIVDLFSEVKNQIIGAVSGNHEQRIEDFCGDNPLRDVCFRLGISYCGYMAVVDFRVGWREDKKSNAVQYTGVFHHTTGGGQTVGSKLNRVEKLRSLCRNADLFCGGHNHMIGAIPVVSPEFNPYAKVMTQRTQLLVDCGGYLEWNNSYAESKGLEPLKIGSPVIKLDGINKNIFVSF
jgi:hypothetical protein